MNKPKNKKSALQTAFAKLQKLAFSGTKGKGKTKFSKIKYRFEVVEDEAGQSLFYPELEVGAPVTVGTEAGGEVASDGWYAIDNAEIRVEDGVIAEIVKAETDEEFEETEDVSELPAEVMEVLEQCVTAIAEVQAEVEAIHTEVEEVKEEVSEVVDATAEFRKQPFSKSVTKADKFNAQGVSAQMKNLAGILGKKN